jgi:polyisoprenoid-binding protein YceI
MKIYLLIFGFVLTGCTNGYSQLYMTRTGYIGFYSKAPLEDIKADNNQVYAVVDVEKKNLAFTLLMKGFLFAKELQQEHFNENYVESDKFPKATFSGSFSGEITPGKDGVYNIHVKGNLMIHGVTKEVEIPATLELKDKRLLGNGTLVIRPEDYQITIPSIVRDKIAKEVTITIRIECNPR